MKTTCSQEIKYIVVEIELDVLLTAIKQIPNRKNEIHIRFDKNNTKYYNILRAKKKKNFLICASTLWRQNHADFLELQ